MRLALPVLVCTVGVGWSLSPHGASAQVATDPEAVTHPCVVSTAWAARHLNDTWTVVIDARGKVPLYSAGHLPGAVFLNIENLRATLGGVPAMLLPAEDLARRLGGMGVTHRSLVIVYGDQNNVEPTYVALALDRLGHATYAIMEGGYAKWVAEGRRTTTALPRVEAKDYGPVAGSDTFTVDLAAVRVAVEKAAATYLDSRSPADFAGTGEGPGGHLPGAVNHPVKQDLLGEQSPLWKPIPLLRESYEAHGLKSDSPVIVGCRTGHSASHAYFTLRHVLGFQNVKWYDGSFTEWLGNPDLPVLREGVTDTRPAEPARP